MHPPPAAATAVPFAVPARFLATGLLALTLAATVLAIRPDLLLGSYAAPGALAVVHLATLAFATMVLVGALHQLVPVLVVAPLHSARLGTVAYSLLLPGAVAVVLGFAFGYRVVLLASGGALVVAGLLVFDLNLWRTVRAARTLDAVGRTLLTAAAYLTATAVLGSAIALTRVLPPLASALGTPTGLHLALGLFGAFFLAIAAAGHKLLAMFVLAHGVSQVRLRGIASLVHGAVALSALAAFLDVPVAWVPAAFLAAAVVLFTVDLVVILRKRMRKVVDVALWPYLATPAPLLASIAFAVAGEVPAAVASLLLGFLPMAVAGMMIKIASFLAWQRRYAPGVGREAGAVPMLRDMQVAPLSLVTLAGQGAAAVALPCALAWSSPDLARVGTMAFAVASWSLLAHVGWIATGRHAPRGAALRAAPVPGGAE